MHATNPIETKRLASVDAGSTSLLRIVIGVAVEMPLYSITAFRYHRVPPQVLALYPPLPDTFNDPSHRGILHSPTVVDLLKTPLHRLSLFSRPCTRTKFYRTHVVSRELPFGSVLDTDHNFQVTSPAFTLLGLATQLAPAQLLMAAYELCGTYSAFSPNARTEAMLSEALAKGLLTPRDGWRRVIGSRGKPLDLWKRDPILNADELTRLTKQLEGFHGIKRLRWAVSHMTGICASPFEAKASILLGLPKASGGLGLVFTNNHRIALSGQAQELYQKSCCYADLFFEGTETHSPVAVECQGASVHGGEAASLSDAARTAALQLMGVEVIPITHEQIEQQNSWNAIKRLLALKLDIDVGKTSQQKRAETNLRHDLFEGAIA